MRTGVVLGSDRPNAQWQWCCPWRTGSISYRLEGFRLEVQLKEGGLTSGPQFQSEKSAWRLETGEHGRWVEYDLRLRRWGRQDAVLVLTSPDHDVLYPRSIYHLLMWGNRKKKGKKKKKPVTLGTGNHSHANMVANLNLLEVLMILRELETGSFRQAPDARNALHAVQSNADKYSV